MYIPRGTLIRDTKLTKTVNVIPLKAVRLKIHLNILSKTGCHFLLYSDNPVYLLLYGQKKNYY